jgi:tRNA U54 and U55 pseudouridine synthase Pus10
MKPKPKGLTNIYIEKKTTNHIKHRKTRLIRNLYVISVENQDITKTTRVKK